MKKFIMALCLALVIISTASFPVYADIFGNNQKLKGTQSESIDPETILSNLASIISYLGAREGFVYDFHQREICNAVGATLYTYQPYNLALDINLLNTDGLALTIDWNLGKIIPCEEVPIMKIFKYLYVGGGIGTRYTDSDKEDAKRWRASPVLGAQFKVTF